VYIQIGRCQIKSKVLKAAFGKKKRKFFDIQKKYIYQIAKKDQNLYVFIEAFIRSVLCRAYIYLNIYCISASEYIIYKFWYGLLIEGERERVRERHVIDCSIVLTLAKFECPMFSQRSAHFTKESSVPRDGRSSIVEAETPRSPDPKTPDPLQSDHLV